MISLDVKGEVIRLRALDYSFDKIANTLDISKPKVMEICADFTNDIERVKNEQIEIITSELTYTAQERSALYRELIRKVHSEILARDITDIPTERLFMMLERLERSLANIEPKQMNGSFTTTLDNMSDEDIEKIIIASNAALAT